MKPRNTEKEMGINPIEIMNNAVLDKYTREEAKHKDYHDMCYSCGEKEYPKKRKDGFGGGIGVSMGVCPVCREPNVGIIPGRDWAYRAGAFEKVL